MNDHEIQNGRSFRKNWAAKSSFFSRLCARLLWYNLYRIKDRSFSFRDDRPLS